MLEKLTVVRNENEGNTLTIHPTKANELKVKNGLRMNICFGTKKEEVTIKIADQISSDTVLLSSDTITNIHLPINSLFDLKVSGTELLIGPFVGILAAYTNEQLVKKLKKLSVYSQQYDLFRGVIIAFSLDGINTQNQTISGFTYNPKSCTWERGFYSYPSSIYRKIPLQKWLKEHLIKHIGHKIFNSDYFSKWDMYRWLQNNEKVKDYLPKTILYKEPNDIIAELKSQPSIYLKPLSGLKGRGIKEVSKKGDTYIVRYREKEQNHVLDFNEKSFIRYLNETLVEKKYIVQRRLDLIFEKEKVIDFRLFVSKNEVGKWVCLGWVARHGVPKSIVSNRSSGGKIRPGNETLQQLFLLDEKKLMYWRKDLFQIACEASKTIESETRNFGFFAIDVAIDTNGDYWIIEMNHRSPNDRLPLYIKDIKTYNSIKVNKMLYLRYLAGF
ncbi:MAG: YheC/YheD family protein [Bacillota bacterium]